MRAGPSCWARPGCAAVGGGLTLPPVWACRKQQPCNEVQAGVSTKLALLHTTHQSYLTTPPPQAAAAALGGGGTVANGSGAPGAQQQQQQSDMLGVQDADIIF